MNEKARRRAIRIFVGSMLASDLTRNELRQIADDLSFGSFGGELGIALRDVTAGLGDSPSEYYPVNAAQAGDYPAELAFDVITRRKLSKRIVLNSITTAAPKLAKKILVADGSTRDLLQRFFDAATSAEQARLLNLLNGDTQDAYLKGIARRD